MKAKEYLTKNVTHFLNKNVDYEENFKIVCCENTGENKTPEENCAENFKKINLNLCHQVLYSKMEWYNGDLLQFIPRCTR